MMAVLLMLALGFPEAEDLFARVRRANPTLANYTAAAEVKLDATMGPMADRRTLQGTYHYVREGQHKLDLPDAPSYLKGKTDALGFSLPRLERYSVKSFAQEGKELHLELVPKTPQGSIERLEMWIDPQQRTVREYDTYYSNGQLQVGMTYSEVEGYRVADTMHAQFRFPNMGLQATVDVRYSDFRFNQESP